MLTAQGVVKDWGPIRGQSKVKVCSVIGLQELTM